MHYLNCHRNDWSFRMTFAVKLRYSCHRFSSLSPLSASIHFVNYPNLSGLPCDLISIELILEQTRRSQLTHSRNIMDCSSIYTVAVQLVGDYVDYSSVTIPRHKAANCCKRYNTVRFCLTKLKCNRTTSEETHPHILLLQIVGCITLIILIGMEILDKGRILNKRLISEMLHIKRQKNSLNLQTDTEYLDETYNAIIYTTYKHPLHKETYYWPYYLFVCYWWQQNGILYWRYLNS